MNETPQTSETSTTATAASTPPVTTPTASASSAGVNGAMDGLIDISQFAAVKMRVAQIKTVEKVEKSNKLYKIQVDVGELGERQIVSGIAKFYTPEQLIGRKIIIVANLKPAMLMGVESQGMLLAASSADKTQLSLLMPSEEMPIGSTIS